MLHTLLALSLLAGPELYAENELYPDLIDYIGGSGVASGLFGMQVCTQDADDVTPGVGVGYGPLGLGCNILITADGNTGAAAITTFDGVPAAVPGTPGSILYIVGPATAALPTTIADAGNFELETAWSAPLTGSETRVLILECIAADTFVEVGRHNGDRYFDAAATIAGVLDAESHMALGNGTALSDGTTLVIDRDFSNATSGEALSVTGSQIEVTAGTGDILHALMSPGATTFSTAATVHGYAATLNILEPNIVLADGATVTNAATVRIVNAPSEGGTMNAALWVDSGLTKLDGALTVDGLTTLGGGLAMGGDLDMQDNAIKNPLVGIYGEAPVADTDPDDILIHAEHAFSSGSQTAANLVLSGGLGDGYVFESTDYLNSTGDELTIIVGHCAAGVCATLGTVTLTESTHWDCDVTSDNVCACALYTYLAANLPTGIASVSRSDGTCTDSKVFLQPEDAGTYSLALAAQDTGGGGVWGTATNGADGVLIVAADGGAFRIEGTGNNVNFRNLADTNYPDVYAAAWYGTGNVRAGASSNIAFTGLTELRAGAGGQDGALLIQNAAESWGAQLYASAADELTLRDMAGTGAGTLEMGAGGILFGAATRRVGATSGGILWNIGQFFWLLQGSDNSVDGSAMVIIESAAAAEMTADGNGEVQYALHVTPELAMTNASAFVGWEHDPDITTQGTAQNYHYRLDWGNVGAGSYEMKVQDDGDLILHEDPGSDTDPLDAKLFGANAWAQATAGQQDGANLELFAGIRTMALVCATPAVSDQDEIVFTINGVAQAALVESTDWDCFGETNDQCCINLAAAIVTADYGIVPDAVTLAGTVYLTPDEDLGSVDSIVLTDSIAADGHGITLTEGTDGQLFVPHGTNTLPGLSSSRDPNTGLTFAGDDKIRLISGGTYRLQVGASVLLNGVPLNVNSQAIQNAASLNIDAAGYAEFDTRTKWTSSGDGIWEMGINAGTKGWRVDVATLDGTASLYDESGGALILGANTFQNSLIGATATFGSVGTTTAAATGAVDIGSGNNTNAGDLATGNVTLTSGDTTDTDGDSGDVTVGTGAAIAGAADAGDLYLQTNDVARMTITGAGAVSTTGNLSIGELLYLDDDGDSYITGTNTDDVIELYSAVAGGTGYTTILSPNGAGYLAVGDTSATEPSRLSIVDGGADNEAGELVLYDDGGTGHFFWVNTADVFRAHNTAPADDDAAGFALMDLSSGLIGAVGQDGTFLDVTLADDLLLADDAVVGITGNEIITFDDVGTVTVSGATLDVASAKNARTANTLNVESVTFPGGGGAASQVTVGSIVPDGAILDGITTRVTTADNGGACTGYTVGDGVDIDLYGVAATETQGTTTTPASATASISNPQFGGPYEVTITGTGGACIDMVVAITAHYRLLTAATSN